MTNRKPFPKRALTTRSTSRRFRAGTRRNKRLKNVGSFASDSRVLSEGVPAEADR